MGAGRALKKSDAVADDVLQGVVVELLLGILGDEGGPEGPEGIGTGMFGSWGVESEAAWQGRRHPCSEAGKTTWNYCDETVRRCGTNKNRLVTLTSK